MEININCDLGESSKLHSTKNHPLLLEIVNSANIACGYHAGDKATMENTIKISKKIMSALEHILLLMIQKILVEKELTYHQKMLKN